MWGSPLGHDCRLRGNDLRARRGARIRAPLNLEAVNIPPVGQRSRFVTMHGFCQGLSARVLHFWCTRRQLEQSRRACGPARWAQTGSPPSPSPHLIRSTVRRLLRSPRFMGPGPQGIVAKERHSGCKCLRFGDLFKCGQELFVMQGQIPHDPLAAHHF